MTRTLTQHGGYGNERHTHHPGWCEERGCQNLSQLSNIATGQICGSTPGKGIFMVKPSVIGSTDAISLDKNKQIQSYLYQRSPNVMQK